MEKTAHRKHQKDLNSTMKKGKRLASNAKRKAISLANAQKTLEITMRDFKGGAKTKMKGCSKGEIKPLTES